MTQKEAQYVSISTNGPSSDMAFPAHMVLPTTAVSAERLNTGSRNAYRACALLAAVVLRGPDTWKTGIKPVPRKPPGG